MVVLLSLSVTAYGYGDYNSYSNSNKYSYGNYNSDYNTYYNRNSNGYTSISYPATSGALYSGYLNTGGNYFSNYGNNQRVSYNGGFHKDYNFASQRRSAQYDSYGPRYSGFNSYPSYGYNSFPTYWGGYGFGLY